MHSHTNCLGITSTFYKGGGGVGGDVTHALPNYYATIRR